LFGHHSNPQSPANSAAPKRALAHFQLSTFNFPLTRALFDFVQRLFQLAFEIADVETDGAGAVKDSDANHDHIEALARRGCVRMIVKIVIDALPEGMKVAQTDDRRQASHRTGIFDYGRKGDAARIDKRDLGALCEKQNQIRLAGFGMHLFLKRAQVAPRDLQSFPRSNVEQDGALDVVGNRLAMSLSPLANLQLCLIDRRIHNEIYIRRGARELLRCKIDFKRKGPILAEISRHPITMKRRVGSV